ncbi:Tubulin-specific chaperone A [Oopsacas minuta]|uniref:Tubulin-specific chaperone A n=1 Tax=Oopsacas minuta TaxID=111878 RepID=A0AAV7JQR1_9METZ|nr:Tubulin-specific chaperone A [Oopsacas minuta]
MATVTADNTKQLRIQTGVVKRVAKEKVVYLKELEINTAKVEKIRESGGDESQIKYAVAILDETKNVIPDTEKRLLEGYLTLEQLVKSSEDRQDTTEYKDAVEVLATSKPLLPV